MNEWFLISGVKIFHKTYGKLNVLNCQTDVENIVTDIPNDQTKRLRVGITNDITNLKSAHKFRCENNFQELFRKSLRSRWCSG